ncbi:HAMP domain-containing sensor histidine kinase [Porphyrobacter sp. YT40]|uniref:sensor histidine kinase n=1 Tax=Porphyrobacter sp. YT40 TaxID=2547601 RepID=UPI0011411204|nr:HAMP domain-containing sensor histidine kinase [Porphyrobacter sp. YT40]QDH34803.1 HAMP domain-containing histidine kinase [Porphyrobacter sp. YT40]
MDQSDSLLGAYGLIDAQGRLMSADAPLAELQERCGGDMPGTLAIPELLALVQQARGMGLRLARSFSAFDGDAEVSGFARIHPLGPEEGGGCELLIENWQRSNVTPPSAREYAERLDAIDRATAEVSARLDARQRIVVLSARAPDALGLQAAALATPGQVWSALVELQGITHRQPLHWRLLDGAMCRFDGSPRHWRVRLIPLGPDTQNPAGFELLLIAEEPLAEPPAAPAADEVPDASPTRLVGTALTPVLRQPVARIIANAETIRARLAGPLREEYSDYAGTIASAGQHLAAMLDDLADLEVVETPGFVTAKEPVDLADAAGRAAGILGVRAQNRDTLLVIEGERGAAVANAEFRRVLQILINLIGNAIAYAPPASTVTISAAPAGEGSVAVTVADQGQGITPEQAERIFDKGERLGRDSDDGRDRGSGLGLYISRRLAEAMDGNLTVEPAPGGGALFRLELPSA